MFVREFSTFCWQSFCFAVFRLKLRTRFWSNHVVPDGLELMRLSFLNWFDADYLGNRDCKHQLPKKPEIEIQLYSFFNFENDFQKRTQCTVKIDSRTRSFCLCQYVQYSLSYSGKETRPKLCLKRRQANSGIRSLGTNKHQLLHRIQSVRTFTNLQ